MTATPATLIFVGLGGSFFLHPAPTAISQHTDGRATAAAQAPAGVPRAAGVHLAASVHAYRHGAVPALGRSAATRSPESAVHAASNNLAYGGGTGGVGVTVGHERVYLVFWGTQWGTGRENGHNYTTFSGDPDGVAPRLEAFFRGLGTGGESWSGVMTQYCQTVAAGSTSCPSAAPHVAYPKGGALAGIWEDTTARAPASASALQIEKEASRAAVHFGNQAESANVSAQYVVVSPTGTNPDDYENQGFCAWHDYTGDPSLSSGRASSAGPTVAFTNLPYLPDVGTYCGANFVNPGAVGKLDGVTIVEGHEYAETITDQFPSGGWVDSTGAENGDKCAWITSGQGMSQNISLGTGSFPVQSTWANDFQGGRGGCEVTHPVVTGSHVVTLSNPGKQVSQPGKALHLQIHASDSAQSGTLTFSASGLPTGLVIGRSNGLISGTPKTNGTFHVRVVASDASGAIGSASFVWTIGTAAGCWINQLLGSLGLGLGTGCS